MTNVCPWHQEIGTWEAISAVKGTCTVSYGSRDEEIANS